MPDSVKISELNSRTAVASDVLPAVDSTFSQTVRVTAASVAAIGGGPPGDGTVTTAKLADNSVTAQKTSFTAPNKLFSRILTGAGQGVEIDCSPFARGFLAIDNASQARGYLDALQSTNSPVFTGQVQVGRGTYTTDPVTGEIIVTPAIAPSVDPDTGFWFPEGGVIGFASNGREAFRFTQDGTILTRSQDESVLRGRHGAVAWVNFDGFSAGGGTTSFLKAQHTIAGRYGLTIPGAPSAIMGVGGTSMQTQAAATRDRIRAIEQARGYNVQFPDELETTPDASWFSDAYGKVNYAISPAQNKWPQFALGSSNRANYTSPGDDRLWYWNGTAWVLTSASGKGWIGTMTLTSINQGTTIREARGITAVTRTGQGAFTVTFEQAMPDNAYCTVVSASGTNDTNAPPIIRITGQSQTAVSVAFHNGTAVGTLYDPQIVSIAVFR